MGKSRSRYNEKARTSSRNDSQKPHPKPRGGTASPPNDATVDRLITDTNEELIISRTKEDKIANKRYQAEKKLKPEMSAKKKKRLEKYIAQKLKKEEHTQLLEKLSTSAWSSELMKSSREIGRSKETTKEKLRRALVEEKHGIPLSNKDVRLFVRRHSTDEGNNSEVNDNMDARDYSIKPIPQKSIVSTVMTETLEDVHSKGSSNDSDGEQKRVTKISSSLIAETIVGSALKRTATGLPIPQKRKKRRKKQSTIPEAARMRFSKSTGAQKNKNSTQESDSSFDSSDSENESFNEKEKAINSTSEEQKEEEYPKHSTALEEAVLAAANVSDVLRPLPRTEDITTDIRGDDIMKETVDARFKGLIDESKAAFFVSVRRNAEIQQARMKLPICGEEQIIMETVRNHPVTIICGETGSGKTTQVPQFLFEAGYSHPNSPNPGLIGITQPRRVAAVSMAQRVAQELGEYNRTVSYQVRYDGTVSSHTRIKFMTDGVLLRELGSDFLLSKYSVIIIDEAHERSLNTDILIGVVSRVLRLRAEMSAENRESIKPLRIIIMSATLRVADFTENRNLFDTPPPVLKIDARQYPVSIHFSRRTPKLDYVAEAYKKIVKIHQRLPAGGILVFLTGQNEISVLCKKLRKRFPTKNSNFKKDNGLYDKVHEMEAEETIVKNNAKIADIEVEELEMGENDEPDLESFDSEDEEEDDEEGLQLDPDAEPEAPLYVLPLYALLPTAAQLRIFDPPPPNSRLCVIATNVAETSLTIPGIKYVIDCGKVKERQYDINTGVQSFEVGWTSKASADQRSGRAGRTAPGHAYRLYSSAVFDNEFSQFSTPEINRMPIEGVVLQMKAMNIDNVMNFPFPTPPNRENMRKAEQLLVHLGALDPDTKNITDLGRTMALFPLPPRCAKMLIIGQQHGCLPYTVAIVSALCVGDPIVKDYQLNNSLLDDSDNAALNDEVADHEQELKELHNPDTIEKEKRKLWRRQYYAVQAKHAGLDPLSDLIKILNMVGAYEFAGATERFCEENFLRPKAMSEIHKLRGQLTNLLNRTFLQLNSYVDPKMLPPNATQLKALRQIIAAGFIDSVAVRKDLISSEARVGTALGRRAKSTRGVAYRIMWADEDVFIHPNSVLYHGEPPEWVVYEELFKTTKIWLKGITAVEPKWLSKLGQTLLTYGKPLDHPTPKFNSTRTQCTCYVTPSFGPKGWLLPPVEITQKRVGSRWIFERK